MELCLQYGDRQMAVDVPEQNLVRASQPGGVAIADIAGAVHSALEAPLDYPPLRLALTPGDHVAILIDERLPDIARLATPILQHIISAQVEPDDVTLLMLSNDRQDWLEDFPDVFQEIRTEVHDPTERKKLSYLAATKKGRRIYLNRTMVDADQLVVLSGRRFDITHGYGGGEGAIYPAYSDEETRRRVNRQFSMRAPESDAWHFREEAAEVSWLLGAPFYVHVIEGANSSITDVLAGPLASSADCNRVLNVRRRIEVERPAELVIATIDGNSSADPFADVAAAFASASRVVREGGRIIVLSGASFDEDERMCILSQGDEPGQVLQLIQKNSQWDVGPVFEWCTAACHAKLSLKSDLPPMAVEEMFAAPLEDVKEVQRLIDAADSCLVLRDAHQKYAEVC